MLVKNWMSTPPITVIITNTDILRALISLTDINQRGIQFSIKIKDRSGAVKDVSDVIRDYGGRVVSILSTQDWVGGYLNVYICAYGVDQPTLERIKEVIEQTATVLYIIDHERKTREIYEEDLA